MPTFTLGGKTLATQTGTAEPVLADSVVYAKAGGILQVQNYTDTTAWTQVLDTDFETLVNGSGVKFAVSITPTLTGSKTIVTVSFGSIYGNSGVNFGLGVRLCRNGTPIKLSTATDSTPLTTFSASNNQPAYLTAVTAVIRDETLNTKDVAVEYTVQMQKHSTTFTMGVNRTDSSGNNNYAYQQRTSSHMIAMEVVA
tara:strand:- start:12002 stop:12592 length:591 start_codon:yes stop_codon:yes gene_type:complete